MVMTADALDAAVLRRCWWKAATAPLTQAERLLIANEEIAGHLYPRVIAARADYYHTVVDQNLVASQELYRLPALAYGPIKDICTVDTQGVESSVELITGDELGHGYSAAAVGGVSGYAMYFAGDCVGLRPIPAQTQGSLRMRYYRQPNALVLLATCAKITARADIGGILDGLELDTDLNPLYPATMNVDILAGGNAHQWLDGRNASIGALNATVVIATGRWASTVSVGDYIAPEGQTPIVQLPDFMLTAAIRRIAAACLIAAGDERAGAEVAEAERLIDLALRTAIPRIEGEPKVIRTINSPFRMRGYR